MTPSEAAAYELKQLEKQAEHINRNTLVCVVEDNLIKRVGNMLCPECLWIDFELGIDNLDILRGLPKVIIFPKSEESAKKWKTKLFHSVCSPFSSGSSFFFLRKRNIDFLDVSYSLLMI